MFETFFSGNSNKTQALLKDGVFTFWEEHCTECAVPECYTACPLFDQRIDNRCKRFNNGIEQVNGGFKIVFKRWAKLETRVFFIDSFFYLFLIKIYIDFLNFLFAFMNVKRSKSIRNRWWYARHSIQWFAIFLSRLSFRKLKVNNLEISFDLNANNHKSIIFKLFSDDGKINFSQKIESHPGVNNHSYRIPTVEKMMNLRSSIEIDDSSETEIVIKKLVLSAKNHNMDLDFINPSVVKQSEALVKCIVWDLDNTLWNGVLIETENWKKNLTLNLDFVNYIKFSDSRGILHSIASKNDLNQVIEVLDYFGIRDYFLFPQVSWGPKSSSLLIISRQLNVGIDSLVLIDDSIFEREEVSFSLPSVRCLNPLDFDMFSDYLYEICANSSMGSERRKSYIAESARVLSRSNLDNVSHFDFLNTLGLKVTISDKFGLFERDRCFELVQRTNQLNLRTYRYSRDEYDLIFTNTDIKAFHFSVEDKFGDYGLVGFVAFRIGNTDIELSDLVISCRVAQKKVEMTVLKKLISIFGMKVCAKFYPTERNFVLKEVLLETGFRVFYTNYEYIYLEYTENSNEKFDFIKVNII